MLLHSRLFYGQLVEQPSVALLSRPTVFFHYSFYGLYCGQINENEDDNDDDDDYDDENVHSVTCCDMTGS